MTPTQRTLLVHLLIELTRVRRHTGWQPVLEFSSGRGPIVAWCECAKAYGAEWMCGRVAAADVARLLT